MVGLVLTVAGVAVAAYLTYAHYTSASNLSCPDTGLINCSKVTTSSYSRVFGLPVSVLGLAFFVGMVPLQLPAAWRSQWAPLRLARLGATVVGVGLVLWLIYVELFRLDAICLYCTAVHALTILLFISTALGTVSTAVYAEDDEPEGD
ncbi:vitamin K epoxide reductase family protein [Acidiferrimicrobium sp. IK]|nr:vitamin K epoxide reductase family protein [Acidiferrimicrobium sp. IK]